MAEMAVISIGSEVVTVTDPTGVEGCEKTIDTAAYSEYPQKDWITSSFMGTKSPNATSKSIDSAYG